MITDIATSLDPYLDKLKNGLTVSAVLKAELGAVKSSCANTKIFAYEGVDDKVIYSHWLSKIHPEIEYEPFICRNKDQLLQLWKSLKSDLTGMNEDVFFFTDRDFDDLKGGDIDNSIFMTEKYSIENYLVDNDVLEEILKIELHCHGNIEARKKIILLFESTYDFFLNTTSDINFRIYLARKCKIKQISEITNRLDDLADVQLNLVKKGRGRLEEMICLEREPTEDEITKHDISFKLLEQRNRYRGKFALYFFRKWLSLLLADRKSDDSSIFCHLPQNDFAAKLTLSFEQLAAKSKPPESFQQFIANIRLQSASA